jgi:hypothetical protein
MNINTFIEKITGSWFSQRTTYNINQEEVDNSKANLTINLLDINTPEVKEKIAQKSLNIDNNVIVIAEIWDTSPDWGKPNKQGNSFILLSKDEGDLTRGEIWRFLSNNEVLEGKYILAEDESLTLTIEKDDQYVEERIWFANDNLRLRNTVVKNDGAVVQTCFYSEIKKISAEKTN